MANNRPIRARRFPRVSRPLVNRVARAVERKLERANGSQTHLIDFTCDDVVTGATGCPTTKHVAASGACVGVTVFELVSDRTLPPPIPGNTTGRGAIVLSHVECDLFLQPDLFEEQVCDAANVAQAVLFRWYLRKTPLIAQTAGAFLDEKDDRNPFEDGNYNEDAEGILMRGQHYWYPQTELQYMLADSVPSVDPCQLAVIGSGDGPDFPAANASGTIVGSAYALITYKEPPPFHLRFNHRRRTVIKGDEALQLVVAWGNPTNGCVGGRNVVDFGVEVTGFVRARQSLVV